MDTLTYATDLNHLNQMHTNPKELRSLESKDLRPIIFWPDI